ncbi:MAG: ethanolamine ammonia-lyase reactivating factor EutA [Oscillospiraceae bacterium]|nr:ethanolamine ammonia-lyase reactivating factor EutA [Oscillospiraceae bacterium]
MSDCLLSVGLDIGTTSTQMVLSRLKVQNRAGGFSVPEMEITERQVLYKSPVHFTPLLDAENMDAQALRMLIQKEYENAGITPDMVDTGAIIITGESSRKENARRVLEALADMAGDFVVTAAGPDLESVLAAKGSGAVAHSGETTQPILHMDIGGGTSNLAWIREEKIHHTGCLNVGGRLVTYDDRKTITYVSPVLQGFFALQAGRKLEQSQAWQLAQKLAEVLEMAAGLRPWREEGRLLLTREAAGQIPEPDVRPILSFSGGVADCIAQDLPWDRFGDLGPLLGRAIRNSNLCRGEYLLGKETIRATVIGAGCHTTRLSGSTVFFQNISFPMKNLPAIPIEHAASVPAEEPVVLLLPWDKPGSYPQICALAEELIPRLKPPVLLCMEQDMAKALGQALALRLPPGTPVLCMDRVRVGQDSYLDIGAPVGGAIALVVKTLVLGNEDRRKI